MYAQLITFTGPRSTEQLAAADRANAERIQPALLADPQLKAGLVANYVLRQEDGGEVIVTLVDSLDTLRRGREVIESTDLLPGEDPALLPGPDRVEVYEVVEATTGS